MTATSQLDGADFGVKLGTGGDGAHEDKGRGGPFLASFDELSHLGHRAASKDLVEVGPQSALHKVSEDTDPCDLPWNSGTIKTSSAANTSPPMTLAQMAALHLMGCSLTRRFLVGNFDVGHDDLF